MLKILVAPASYKGSIAAHRLAAAIVRGCRELPQDIDRLYGEIEIIEAPIADGGDDTLVSLNQALGGELVWSEVLGPTGQAVRAAYLRLPAIDPKLAIVELAMASGIAYLSGDQLSALSAHTYGTGQLIERAIAGGATKIVVTVGGSASIDGGTAALSALGAKFLDSRDQVVSLGGGGLRQIARIDLSQLLLTTAGVSFVVATDVTSPLLGELGAAAVFGPQKGAGSADVKLLDDGLAHFAALAGQSLDPQLVSALTFAPGAGAAGGAGFGFASFLAAEIVSGFHYLSELLGLRQKVEWCDLIIVAEGKLDSQSVSGKGVGEIISLAAGLGKIVLALPALSELTAAKLAVLVQAPEAGKIIVAPTASGVPGSMASLADVQAATTRALSDNLLFAI